MKAWTVFFITFVLLVLSGCTPDTKVNQLGKISGSNITGNVTIFCLSPDSFSRDYGTSFKILYPDINITFVSYEEALRKNDKKLFMDLLQKNHPDVIIASFPLFQSMVNQRLLDSLDPYIQQDKLSTKDWVEPVVDYLRSKGSGQLLGLTPEFNSSALFYNRTLFDKYNIPYPTDNMTWDDVLSLAKRFPTGEGIFGYEHPHHPTFDPMYLINSILQTEGLSYWRSDASMFAMGNSQLYGLTQKVIDGYKIGYIYSPYEGNSTSEPKAELEMFAQGKAAMTEQNYYYLNTLENERINHQLHYEWSVVPEPIQKNGAPVSYSYLFSDMFSIYAYANNKPGAWEVIKFIQSKETAKAISLSSLAEGFSIYKSYLHDKQGHDLSAFAHWNIKDDGFIQYLTKPAVDMAKKEMLSVLDGSATIEEAWNQIGDTVEENFKKTGQGGPP